MKNISKILLVIALGVSLLCTAFACTITDDSIRITYMNGDEVLHQELLQGDLDYQPTLQGYTFEGWYFDQQFTQKAELDKITANTTLYAKFAKNSYTVVFYDNDGTIIQVNGEQSQIVLHGESAVAPEMTDKGDSIFIGWSQSFDNVTQDLNVYARYAQGQKTVTFIAPDGSELLTQRLEIGTELNVYANSLQMQLEESIADGFTFDCWKRADGSEAFVETTTLTEDVTYYATIKIDEFAVVLQADTKTINYSPDGTFSLNADLVQYSGIEYTFVWQLDDQPIACNLSQCELTGLEVGRHKVQLTVEATCDDMPSVFASDTVYLNVNNGDIEGVSAQDKVVTYNAEAHNIELVGLQAGDQVLYRLQGQQDYVDSLALVNVGTYQVHYKVSRRYYNDYISEQSVKLQITPATLDVSVDDKNISYGDALPTYTYRVEGLLGNDQDVIHGDFIYGGPANSLTCGEWDITLSGIKADNYTLNITKGKLTIAKRALSIAVRDASAVYGEATPQFELDSQGFISGDSLSILDGSAIFECAYAQGSDAGEYDITVSGYSSDKYDITYTSAKLTVNPKALTITPDGASVTYGDAVPTLTAQVVGLLAQDQASFAYSVVTDYKQGDNAGTYSIWIARINNANYDITYDNTAVLTVNPKPLTITPIGATATYGDAVPTLTAKVDGLIEQDQASFAYSVVTNYEQGDNAGTYSIWIARINNANYAITYKEAVLTVNPKPLTITPIGATATYGDAVPTLTAQVDGLIEQDQASFAYSVVTNYEQGDNAGTYSIWIARINNANYAITYKEAVLTVNPKALTITPNDVNVQYGDSAVYGVQYDGFVSGEDSGVLAGTLVVGSDYVVGDNAGLSYVIKASGVKSLNYNITFGTATLNVEKRNLTLYMDNEAVVQHTAYTVSASQLRVSGAYGSIALEGILQATNNVAGEYIAVGELGENFEWQQALKLTLDSVDVTSNYIVNYNLVLTLTENSFGYSAVGVDKTYDGIASQISVTTDLPTGVITYGTDGVNYSAVNPSFVNAGQYTVYYLISDSEGIYDSVSGSKVIKIARATLTATVAGKSIVYGDAIPTYSIDNYQGWVDGDDSTALQGTLTFACDYAQGSQAGKYDITASGYYADNYNITYVPAKLTVGKKALTITPNGASVTYGDAVPTLTAQVVGLIAQDQASFAYSVVTDYKQGDGVGSYDITIEPIVNANYAITYNTATLTVSPKALTITPIGATATYGDAVPTLTAQVVGLIAQDQASFAYSVVTNYAQGGNVGSYDISIAPIDNANYNITYKTAILTVVKKALTITPNDVSVQYGDSAVYGVQYDGLVCGDDSGDLSGTLVVGSDYVVGDDAGLSYVIKVSGYSSDNYDITFDTATLTVQPRSVTLIWIGTQTTYYYNEQDQSNSIQAQYLSVESGVNEYATIVFSGKADKFLLAGDYQATAVVSDNYALTNASVGLTMNKGNYDVSKISVPTIHGVYGPSNLVSAQPYEALPAGFSWKTPNVVPVCADTSMTAIYCTDSANYNALEIQVPIVVQKATVSLKATLYEQDFVSGDVMTITPVIMYNSEPLNSAVSYDLTFTANDFTTAGTYTFVVKFSADNYAMADTTCYAKYKGVDYNGTLYTIEDAIKTATSGTIIVKYNTSFAPASFSSSIYPTDDYFTIKSGVTLLVPYDGNFSSAMDDVNDTATPLSIGAYSTLTVPTGINLVVNGTVNVNGIRSHQSTSYMGHTYNYGQLVLQQGSSVALNNGAVFNSTGYTTGKGFIEAKSGSNVYEVLAIKDFRGGGVTYKIYETMFPFTQYVMQNIESDLRIQYGAFMYARYYMYPSTTVKGAMPVIGSGALFQLREGSYIDKTLDNSTNKTTITLHGTMDTNYAQMTIKVKVGITYTLNVSTQNIEFPFPGNYIIKIASGSVANINNRFKLLPGAQIVVEQGAELNVDNGGRLYAYGSGYAFTKDLYNNAAQADYSGTKMSGNMITKNNGCYTSTTNALIVVDGTLTLGSGGYIGGCIYSNGGGTMVLAHANSSTIKDYYSATKGSLAIFPSVTYYDKTFDLQANTASGQVTLSAGTYTSTGNVWAQ
ncbi:MAG: MBG domain-containing protein [Christensenellales bacterium]